MAIRDVQEDIRRHADEYMSRLQRACRQPSVAAQGQGMAGMAELVAEMARAAGLDAELLPCSTYPVVFAERQGSGSQRLLLYNHYDVQPPEPLALWQSDPFAAEIRDGRLYARGVADNKGNLVARLCAVESYLRVRGELPLSVVCLFEGAEEVGSGGLVEVVAENRERLRAGGCIWETGYKNSQERLEFSLGVKGILYVELRVKTANSDLHSGRAAVIPNAAWRLAWALNSLKGADERIRIPHFYYGIEQPGAADLGLLEGWTYEAAAERERLGISGHLLGLEGEALKQRLQFAPTCNICGLESGYTGPGSKTVLPGEASAKLDFRLVPGQDAGEIFGELCAYLRDQGFDDVEVTRLDGDNAYRGPADAPVVQAVVEAAREVYGAPPVVLPSAAGSGPMHAVCGQLDLPVAGAGVGYVDSQVHAPNENIRLADFVQGIEHVAAIFEHFV